MKKLFALSLCVLLALALCACGAGGSSPADAAEQFVKAQVLGDVNEMNDYCAVDLVEIASKSLAMQGISEKEKFNELEEEFDSEFEKSISIETMEDYIKYSTEKERLTVEKTLGENFDVCVDVISVYALEADNVASYLNRTADALSELGIRVGEHYDSASIEEISVVTVQYYYESDVLEAYEKGEDFSADSYGSIENYTGIETTTLYVANVDGGWVVLNFAD